jgi:hypothetical protein
MSTMQLFRSQLIQTGEVYDPQFKGLAQLMEATPTQVKALASDYGWTDWDAKAA